MENKEMNTEKIKFYKKHPVLLAWLISIFIGLGYALFTIIASVIHYEQRDYVWEIIKIAQVNISVKALMISHT